MTMPSSDRPTAGRRVERGGFILFLALVTAGLIWIAWPFATAILWAALAALIFQPLFVRFERHLGGANRAAIATLLVITVVVVVPAIWIGNIVIEQATRLYLALQTQQIDPAAAFDQVHDALPLAWQRMIDNAGYGDFGVLQQRISQFAEQAVMVVGRQALAIGGSAFAFVLSLGVGLYVLYFLLRDGKRIAPAIREALPLDPAVADRLADRFAVVVRATIKGSVVVGLAQGALGAITFWIVGMPAAVLFGVLMAIFSLLPALGPAIVWLPVAIYLAAIGDWWQAAVVTGSGIGLIGLVDNLLRPVLVGRDTGIPDWIVLVTTLGGIATIGLSGIVVGPLLAGLFLTGWAVLREERGIVRPAATPPIEENVP
ncbi:AI-2E family transporter [Qipengyuania sp. MTN3-11]|uniref:AI-2E family transporter n=1 Tax=Qipengyuania sp. MTN3-11 TaxID=3056557 RepID=UPI0036F37677